MGHSPVTVEFEQMKAEVIQGSFMLFLLFPHVHWLCFHIGRQRCTSILAFLI